MESSIPSLAVPFGAELSSPSPGAISLFSRCCCLHWHLQHKDPTFGRCWALSSSVVGCAHDFAHARCMRSDGLANNDNTTYVVCFVNERSLVRSGEPKPYVDKNVFVGGIVRLWVGACGRRWLAPVFGGPPF